MKTSIPKRLALLSLVTAFTLLVAGTAKATEANDDTIVILSAETEITLSQDEMGENRGASGLMFNTLSSTQELAASSSGNTITVAGNLRNGDITVGNDFGGLGSYVMNTGNNSTINSAVSLNVQFLPAPATP